MFAGLVPRLRADGTWAVVSFRPGSRPFRSLATACVQILEAEMSETEGMLSVDKLSQVLRAGELTIGNVGQRVLNKEGASRLLVIVDQFEELYTLVERPEDQVPFLDWLIAAADRKSVTVALTLRADFLGHALSYRPFADALQQADFHLCPMNRAECGVSGSCSRRSPPSLSIS